MPTSKQSADAIELSFRPTSYFGPQRLETHLASRITGNVRRHLVQVALDAGEDVPAVLLQPS